MARKGENIYRRADGRWEARYIREHDALTGKALYGYLYAKTYREARSQKANAEKQRQRKNKHQKITVKECVEQWLQLKANDKSVRPSTLRQYERHAEKHIFPVLGQVPLKNLDAAALERFRQTKLQNGRLDGTGGLSAAMVHGMMLVLRCALLFAEEKGYITEAPRPKSKRSAHEKKEVRVLSRGEQAALEKELYLGFTSARQRGVCLGIFFALYTGLRVGELSGLRWKDVDLLVPAIHVRHTLQRMAARTEDGRRTELHLGSPKSESSRRLCPIKKECAALLQAYRSVQGAAYCQQQDYVFTCMGRPVEPRVFQSRFKKLLSAAGVEDANFHALRHTFATRCIESGMDVQSLSEYLGHRDANITMRVYAHSFMEQKEQCIQRLSFVTALPRLGTICRQNSPS